MLALRGSRVFMTVLRGVCLGCLSRRMCRTAPIWYAVACVVGGQTPLKDVQGCLKNAARHRDRQYPRPGST
jgi:hypothetical protein